MMRVGLIVVGLSALTIMELGTSPRAKTARQIRSSNQPSTYAYQATPWRRLIGSKSTVCSMKQWFSRPHLSNQHCHRM